MKFGSALKTIVQTTKRSLENVGYPGRFKNFINKILDGISSVFSFAHRISKQDLEKNLQLTASQSKLTSYFDTLKKSAKKYQPEESHNTATPSSEVPLIIPRSRS